MTSDPGAAAFPAVYVAAGGRRTVSAPGRMAEIILRRPADFSKVSHRARRTAAGLAAALVCTLLPAHASPPDYRLGDVATEDVVTPVPLLVVNPDATEALQKRVAEQASFIVFQTPQSTDEAETELRQSLAASRARFLTALQQALPDRTPGAADLSLPEYAETLAAVARTSPVDLPLEQLAPGWVRGESDEPFVAGLLKPLREIMAQPIVASKTEPAWPRDPAVRLIQLENLARTPPVRELEGAGVTVPAETIISLYHARLLVKTAFPLGQEQSGRYAATFVRANAYPDPVLTEALRARRLEGVTVNDTYDAAQVIVQKGQTINRKVLRALAAMREKSLIGTLQNRLEQQQSVAGQITNLTKWLGAGLGAVVLALVLVFRRLRPRPGTMLVPVTAAPALADNPADAAWRDRALVAESRAERAQAAIRAGAMGWMREKFFQMLFRQRADLLTVQQRAAGEMHELEQRLVQLHVPLQERLSAYEKRIRELEQDLAAKGEENRELIGARITVAKQQLALESERGHFGSN